VQQRHYYETHIQPVHYLDAFVHRLHKQRRRNAAHGVSKKWQFNEVTVAHLAGCRPKPEKQIWVDGLNVCSSGRA
jgi:hypothetical protein